MNELKELTHDIITNAFIKALADINKDTAERDKHFVVATELIIKNFRAHIEEFERPVNPITDEEIEECTVDWEKAALAQHQVGFSIGVELYRKALMESLEKGAK